MGRLRPLPPLALAALAILAAGCRTAGVPARAAWQPDSIPEAYAHSVAALMWPGATRAWQVDDGRLCNGAYALSLVPHANGEPAPPARVVAAEDRWLPVLRWTERAGAVRWEFEAVALPEPAPEPFAPRGEVARALSAAARDADQRHVNATLASFPAGRVDALLAHVRRTLERDPVDRANLYVSLQATAINLGATPADARLDLAFQPLPDPPPYLDPDSLVRVPWEHAWDAPSDRDSVMALGDGAAHGRTLAWRATLAPRAVRRARWVLPAYPAPRGALAAWARVPHERRVQTVREHWTDEIERGARFELPDPELMRAIRAARVVLLSLREHRGSDWVPLGGPFHYRDVWLRDGARAIQALAVSGYTDEARALAASLLRFQWPHGPFLSQSGQLDGSGEALWALEQATLRPEPGPGADRYAGAALRAWRALERLRRQRDPKHADAVAGLLPYTDPHDDELVNAQLVGNDAWAIAGYRAAARLLAAAHRDDEADSVRLAALRYERVFRATLARTGARDVPPSWQGRGIDWGNLAVAYPCAALPASDPRLAVLAHRYFAPAGGAGLGYYRTPAFRHGYVAADLGTWALLAHQPAFADSVLDALVWWRSASGGAAETFTSPDHDFGVNFPPHPTSAAALLALSRNMLVFDDGDTLQLTLGARDAWWRGGALRRAPTRWGLVDLEFVRRGDRAEWRWTPVPVWTALTLPRGCVARGPLPHGCRRGGDGVLLAAPGTRDAEVALTRR